MKSNSLKKIQYASSRFTWRHADFLRILLITWLYSNNIYILKNETFPRYAKNENDASTTTHVQSLSSREEHQRCEMSQHGYVLLIHFPITVLDDKVFIYDIKIILRYFIDRLIKWSYVIQRDYEIILLILLS